VDVEDGVEVANSHWKQFEEREASKKQGNKQPTRRSVRTRRRNDADGSEDSSLDGTDTLSPPTSPHKRKATDTKDEDESMEEETAKRQKTSKSQRQKKTTNGKEVGKVEI